MTSQDFNNPLWPYELDDSPSVWGCVMTTSIKERPILFSASMVQAILAGKKTQTRQTVSARNSTVLGYPGSKMWGHLHFEGFGDDPYFQVRVDGPNSTMFGCGDGVQYLHVPAIHPDDLASADYLVYRVRPIWVKGDRLWVRETFCQTKHVGGKKQNLSYIPNEVEYLADCGKMRYPIGGNFATREDEFRWKPSIFMPRWASRLTLEIIAVRAERLRDITAEDAIAEGALPAAETDPTKLSRAEWEQCKSTALACFQSLWRKINGDESWELNPWVWVIEFKRIEQK